MALWFYSPFLHDFAGKGEYNILHGVSKNCIFAVLEVSFWKFLTLKSYHKPQWLFYIACIPGVILKLLCNCSFLFVALMLYGWSVIPFVYVQSFLFNVASSAYVWVTVFNIFSGTHSLFVVFFLTGLLRLVRHAPFVTRNISYRFFLLYNESPTNFDNRSSANCKFS